MVGIHPYPWTVIGTALLSVWLLALGCGCSRVAAAGASHTPFADARHMILFIGDGMHPAHEEAFSRYLTGTEKGLIWHQFPLQASVATWDVSTYNHNAQHQGVPPFKAETFDPVIGYDPHQGGAERYPLHLAGSEAYFLADRLATDSAAAATAMATGHKTDAGNIAWAAGDPPDGAFNTITELMRQQRGSAIGVVSTVPIIHATPAAFVSHNVSREHYFGAGHEELAAGIAEQIIRHSRPEVVIGGGHPDHNSKYLPRRLLAELASSDEYLLVARSSGVDGGKALMAGAQRAIVRQKKLFGLFGGPAGNFDPPRPLHQPGAPTLVAASIENPTLTQATRAALQRLAEDEDGFFLLVEQGDIDWANHSNDYAWMLGAMGDLHAAVEAAVAYVDLPGDRLNWDNTLLIVTSDHGNSYLRFNPNRPLAKGELPTPAEIARWDQELSAGARVCYGTAGHTNELVGLYAKGLAAGLFRQYLGSWYPGTSILDNTQIFRVMKQFALDGPPQKPLAPRRGDSFPLPGLSP